jgi:hypothetical protein
LPQLLLSVALAWIFWTCTACAEPLELPGVVKVLEDGDLIFQESRSR